MHRLLKYLSFLGLALVVGPVLGYLVGSIGKEAMSNVMLIGTVIWFATVPFWMGKEQP